MVHVTGENAAEVRKCDMQVRMKLRLLAHSLTTFGHESAAGVVGINQRGFRITLLQMYKSLVT